MPHTTQNKKHTMQTHEYRQKTIRRVCVVWDRQNDAHVIPQLGAAGAIDAPWPAPSSPPQGKPMSGFNLRTQSYWRDGLVYIDFHNVPFFWRSDLNVSAISWRDQHPLILEAIVRIGLDAAEVEKFREASGRENPNSLDINLPLFLLKQFVDEFDRQLAGYRRGPTP